MKITAQQYANSLYEATKNKSHEEIDGVAAGFIKVLNKNNQTRLIKDIISKFGKVYNQENGIVEAEITSREKLSEDVMTYVRTYVSNKYDAKEVVIKEKIDKSIIGGIVIRVGDEILDGSLNRQLENLRSNLSQ